MREQAAARATDAGTRRRMRAQARELARTQRASPTEAELMCAVILRQYESPARDAVASRMVLEPDSRTTSENVALSTPLLVRGRYRRVDGGLDALAAGHVHGQPRAARGGGLPRGAALGAGVSRVGRGLPVSLRRRRLVHLRVSAARRARGAVLASGGERVAVRAAGGRSRRQRGVTTRVAGVEVQPPREPR